MAGERDAIGCRLDAPEARPGLLPTALWPCGIAAVVGQPNAWPTCVSPTSDRRRRPFCMWAGEGGCATASLLQGHKAALPQEP